MLEEGASSLEPAVTIARDALEDETQGTSLDDRVSPPTTARRRALYFAYGSNLSYSQMRLRCKYDPEQSGKPLAVARLDHWRWLICERGYANVIPPKDLRVWRQVSGEDKVPVSGREDAVFGLLYDMTPEDEYLLDGYEGVDHRSPRTSPHSPIDPRIRPREQGDGDYNKWYVPATITKWLGDAGEREKAITVLVYVDEQHVRLGPPKHEYIGRMNRGIRESVALGLPKDWVDDVIRKAIPKE